MRPSAIPPSHENFSGFQLPDIPVIFPDGAVGGEIAGLADVDQHFPGPAGKNSYICKHEDILIDK